MIDLNDFDEAHPGLLGVGPAPAGGQRLGGRPGERRERGAVRGGGAGLRRGVPGRGALPGRAAAADALATTGWTSTGCTRPRPRSRCGTRSSDRPSGPGTGPATGRCPGSPRARGPAAHRRGAAADHPGAGPTRPRPIAAALDELPADPGAALAAGGRRLHPGRHRPQGGRGGQRRAAGVRGAARGQQPRRRGLPAAQAGPPVGAGPVRARRLGLARPPGPAGGGVPAGAADGQRPAARLDHGRRAGSTTCASSAT